MSGLPGTAARERQRGRETRSVFGTRPPRRAPEAAGLSLQALRAHVALMAFEAQLNR